MTYFNQGVIENKAQPSDYFNFQPFSDNFIKDIIASDYNDIVQNVSENHKEKPTA